jgi:hypothetical protein
LEIGALNERLRGLYVEADPHDPAIRDQFWVMLWQIDASDEGLDPG